MEGGGFAGVAALHAPRREMGAVAVACRDHRVRGEHLELERRAGAAAPAAGAAGIRGEAVLQDLHRHLRLVDFDRGVLQEP